MVRSWAHLVLAYCVLSNVNHFAYAILSVPGHPDTKTLSRLQSPLLGSIYSNTASFMKNFHTRVEYRVSYFINKTHLMMLIYHWALASWPTVFFIHLLRRLKRSRIPINFLDFAYHSSSRLNALMP